MVFEKLTCIVIPRVKDTGKFKEPFTDIKL